MPPGNIRKPEVFWFYNDTWKNGNISKTSGRNRVSFVVFLIVLFLKLYFNKWNFVRNSSVDWCFFAVWLALLNLNNSPTQESKFGENIFFIKNSFIFFLCLLKNARVQFWHLLQLLMVGFDETWKLFLNVQDSLRSTNWVAKVTVKFSVKLTTIQALAHFRCLLRVFSVSANVRIYARCKKFKLNY